jgi:hypothetical protein
VAAIVFKDVSVTINSISLGDHVQSCELNYSLAAVEVSAMNSAGTRTYASGMNDTTFTVTLFQDFATSNVEATVYPLVGTTTTVVVKPTSGTVGANNPSYTIAGAYLASHTPIAAGAPGEAGLTQLVFQGGTIAKAVI